MSNHIKTNIGGEGFKQILHSLFLDTNLLEEEHFNCCDVIPHLRSVIYRGGQAIFHGDDAVHQHPGQQCDLPFMGLLGLLIVICLLEPGEESVLRGTSKSLAIWGLVLSLFSTSRMAFHFVSGVMALHLVAIVVLQAMTMTHY